MTFTSDQVELIVQRVLEHLGTPAGTASVASGSATGSERLAPVSSGVRISDPVVTQALLAETANGAKQVRIGAKAILTPSARDFVRARGIEIIREASVPKASKTTRWQIITTAATPALPAVVDGLKQHGIACDQRLVGLPAEAAKEGISAVCRGEAATVVVFTTQPEVVACLANRNDRVRAAAIADPSGADRVQKSLSPNLIAIDPAGKGAHELYACLKAFIP